MNSNRTVGTSRTPAARSAQLCRLAGCLSALALALPAVLQAQEAAPQPAASSSASNANVAGKGGISGRVLNTGNGMYLSKAVVQVEGTNIETLTGEYGDFELRDLPAGPVTLKISFTGLVTQSVMVTVEADKTLNQEFKLGRSKLTAGKADKDTVALDEFVVASDRFKNAAEIAINEERYSPTIKNVVAADAFGDIPDGNIGEFVKFIPGVQVATGYDNAGSMNALDQNISQVSVRGFGSDMTAITVDGVPLTNASPASLSRSIGLDMMSVNNASRVEVIKVPTPDMPANSPGGAINLVTRSAFEFSKPRVDVKFMFNMNSRDLDGFARKTPGPANKPTQKVLPGIEFSYTLPISNRIGITVSGGASKTFYENQQAKTDYLYDVLELGLGTDNQKVDMSAVGGGTASRVKNADGTRTYEALTSASGGKISPINPLFYRFQATDTPNTATRKNAAVKFDFKPTTSQKISIGLNLGAFETTDAQRRLQFYNGTKWAYLDWGDGYVVGAPYNATGLKTTANYSLATAKTTTGVLDPKATINMNTTTRDRAATTNTGYVDYVFAHGPWKIDANINGSKSVGAYKDLENGHFSDVETSLTAGQLKFSDINQGIPGRVEVFDKTGAILDWTKLKNWSALATNGLKAKSGDTHSSDTNFNAKINVRRDLDFIPISWMTMTAKAGWYRQEQTVKKWGLGTGYYVTYDAVAAGSPLTVDNYIDDAYSRSPGFNLPAQEWLDNYKLYKLWQDNPNAFSITSEQNKSDNYKSWAGQQKDLKETSDQAYFQLEGRALKNRLSWVTGMRQETATRKGYLTKNIGTWNFLHNENGTMWRDTDVSAYATGIRIDQASSLLFQGYTIDATTGAITGGTPSAANAALRARLTKDGIAVPDKVIFNNTLAAAKLQRIPFVNIDGKTTNKPNFMGSVGYEITKSLTARLSYSKTSGRPDWENGVLSVGGGNLDISENTDATSSPRGTITQSNPDLKPSENDSYDAQLAYYTKTGGKFAVSGFYKLTKNPQETIAIFDGDSSFDDLLTNLNLNPDDFRGWAYKTTVNTAGTGKTIGYELEAAQELGILGGWGKCFHVFSSFSHHYKKQTNTNYLTLRPTAGTHASGGINFQWRDLSILTRAVWLEEKYMNQTSIYTLDGQPFLLGKYTPSTLNVDLNMRYQLTKNLGVFFNARNVLNPDNTLIRKDANGKVPDWAKTIETKQYGVTMVVGLSATF